MIGPGQRAKDFTELAAQLARPTYLFFKWVWIQSNRHSDAAARS